MRHNAAMLAFANADNAVTHEYAADSLYQHYVTGWTDAHIPRTSAPLRFHHVVAFYWQDGTIATPRSVWTSRSRIVPLPRS